MDFPSPKFCYFACSLNRLYENGLHRKICEAKTLFMVNLIQLLIEDFVRTHTKIWVIDFWVDVDALRRTLSAIAAIILDVC